MSSKLKLTGLGGGDTIIQGNDVITTDQTFTLPDTGGEVAVKGTDGSVDLGDVNIDSSGRLLVGTSSPATVGDSQYAKLQIRGNTISQTGILSIQRSAAPSSTGDVIGSVFFTDDSGNNYASMITSADAIPGTNDYPGRLVFSTSADGASSPTERMRIRSDGRINTYSEAEGLSVSVADTASLIFIGKNGGAPNGGGTNQVFIYNDGDIANTNNSYGPIASDERLKRDIIDANSQWDDIKNIRITNFRYKNDPAGPLQLGPIAQELEQVSPGLITRRPASEDEITDPSNGLVEGDEVLSFKASILYMKAVKALQEAMERIETLEAKVTALEANP